MSFKGEENVIARRPLNMSMFFFEREDGDGDPDVDGDSDDGVGVQKGWTMLDFFR